METGVAKIKVRLGSGRVVEVVPLRRAWQPRFFLAREAEDKPVLMIHETQVVWEKATSGMSNAEESTTHPGPMTPSSPLARPDQALAQGQTPFAASQAAQVPGRGGEGDAKG
jgi:hypothetical protein